ncbi:MAG: hypothetical protein WBJ84_08180 [Bacteroidales bacterium]
MSGIEYHTSYKHATPSGFGSGKGTIGVINKSSRKCPRHYEIA